MTEGHFDIRKAAKLDNEGRLKELRPLQLFREVVCIAPGMTCVDLGCGTGTFSFPLALCAGEEGIVYAVDDSDEMLGYLRAKKPPPNLRLIQSDAGHTGLDSQIADFCLLAFVLHEVKQHHILVAEAFRLLKPEGKVAVVEWKPEIDSPGPPRKIRLPREQVKQLFNNAGFTGFKYIDWSKSHYVAVGNKVSLSQSEVRG